MEVVNILNMEVLVLWIFFHFNICKIPPPPTWSLILLSYLNQGAQFHIYRNIIFLEVVLFSIVCIVLSILSKIVQLFVPDKMKEETADIHFFYPFIGLIYTIINYRCEKGLHRPFLVKYYFKIGRINKIFTRSNNLFFY